MSLFVRTVFRASRSSSVARSDGKPTETVVRLAVLHRIDHVYDNTVPREDRQDAAPKPLDWSNRRIVWGLIMQGYTKNVHLFGCTVEPPTHRTAEQPSCRTLLGPFVW